MLVALAVNVVKFVGLVGLRIVLLDVIKLVWYLSQRQKVIAVVLGALIKWVVLVFPRRALVIQSIGLKFAGIGRVLLGFSSSNAIP